MRARILYYIRRFDDGIAVAPHPSMRKLGVLVVLVLQPILHGQSDRVHRRVQVPASFAQIMVRQAIAGARRRLGDPGCQQVLSDYADAAGNSLQRSLEVRGRTPAEFLSELWFADGTGEPPCENGVTAAYTTPGSRVVFVCAARFASAVDALCGPAGEIIIIHELLHALGLGENPPTSEQITRRVWRRCGDV